MPGRRVNWKPPVNYCSLEQLTARHEPSLIQRKDPPTFLARNAALNRKTMNDTVSWAPKRFLLRKRRGPLRGTLVTLQLQLGSRATISAKFKWRQRQTMSNRRGSDSSSPCLSLLSAEGAKLDRWLAPSFSSNNASHWSSAVNTLKAELSPTLGWNKITW